MSERGSAHTSERENNYWRLAFLSLGFIAAIGSHSIYEEVVGFSPLWFSRGKSLCLVSLVIIVVHVILLYKILRSYFLNYKNITLPHCQKLSSYSSPLNASAETSSAS